MKIAIGCDHPAFIRKQDIIEYLKGLGHEIIDCGTYNSTIRTHYPIYGREVAILVAEKKVDFGIAICGTGVGISNSVNKVKGVRCALVRDPLTAKIARERYDVNVISFGGRIVGTGVGIMIVDAALKTKYLGENKQFINEVNQKIDHLNTDQHLFDKIIKNWEDGKYTEGVKQADVLMPRVKI